MPACRNDAALHAVNVAVRREHEHDMFATPLFGRCGGARRCFDA